MIHTHILVMDALFPNKVRMNMVDWGAKQDYECVKNYKVLQQFCNAQMIDKAIDVEKVCGDG